ncbi:FtsH protease activity modulator HflK [Pontibacterium granulatum]|uniref:FtsH protease activity modulator HflK n=1 Tax=Pontibacterium granulatum TaxID=2036029 RepID=UPI00249A4E18|nr:FtsH protease activity modulator HflK [Pontibacterium granulatum]MDI3323690.1 FtsH protease activity modulator HflK [Pontibacterium granulatum]
MAWNEPGGNGNNNDPWGGGGNNRGGNGGGDQGPPDLDEALRKLQDRLNSIFGGSGKKPNSGGFGGNGGGSGSGSASGSGFFIILAVLAALLWAGMGFYTVDQQERGVVLRLGKYSDTVGPGLRWNPPLIDEVQKVNVTQVRTRTHRALMLTKDENIVDVDMAVQYVIADPKSFQLSVRDPEASLSHAAESALRHVVGSTDMHSILTQGRELLSVQVQERLQGYMDDYQTGLQISKVNVKEAKAPSQVQDAFNDVIRAREDEVRVRNEAEAYANGIIPEARGQAQRMLEEANAYREEVIAKAEGESQRFAALLEEYEKAPEVTRERLYLSTMESVLAKSPKVLVDVEGSNNMMYLPLDKLSQSSGAASMPRIDANRPVRLDSESLREVTDQVINQLRQRQLNTRREGR